MIGKNPLWVAKQHGHSAHLMLDVYANCIEGTNASEIAKIEQAMQRSPPTNWHQPGTSREWARQVIQSSGNRLAERRDSNSERQSDQKLLNLKATRSPLSPGNPHSCHWESLSFGSRLIVRKGILKLDA